jgi:RNA polymerase sigma factor (sigma-70 family)
MGVCTDRPPRTSVELAELLAGGTDADLLGVIGAERDRDRASAEAALAELQRRHVSYLYAVCRRICSVYLADPDQAEDLVNRTLWRAFHTAERFEPAKTKCDGDPVCLQRAVHCWLARKAWWLARDVMRQHARRPTVSLWEPETLDQFEHDGDGPPECSEEVANALNRLSARERHVVLATYFLGDCETGKPVPPDEPADAYLARRWGTTQANIRQIRSRALEKLRDMLTASAPRPTGTQVSHDP